MVYKRWKSISCVNNRLDYQPLFGKEAHARNADGTRESSGNQAYMNKPVNDKHLMTGPEDNSEFCFPPRPLMFPETKCFVLTPN